MKRAFLIAGVLALAAGCSTKTMSEAKQEAYARWHHTRAELLVNAARQHYEDGQVSEAQRRLEEALGFEDDNVPARLLLARVYIEQAEYVRAMSQLQWVQGHRGEDPESVYLLGVALERQNRLEEALEQYQRAFALDRQNVAPLLAGTEVLVALGRVREAGTYLESYLALAQENVAAYELAGRIAMLEGRYAAAAGYYEQAGALAPDNRFYREAQGRALLQAGQPERAVDVLEPLARATDEPLSALTETVLADAYLAAGRAEQARRHYQAVLERAPEDGGAWANLAKAALWLDDLPRAVLAARKALHLEPGRQDAALLLGYALMRGGQADEAAKVLRRYASQHGGSAALLCVLGRAEAAGGRPETARRCYERALELEPEDTAARALLAGALPDGLSRASD